MPNLTEEQLQAFYSRIHGNDREILNSDTCSCIFCRQTYSAREISDWIPNPDGTLNAICPICGMDTVIGDKKQGRIDHDDLKEINLRFFGEDYMEKHPEAIQKYIERYWNGDITKKKENENLFKHYLNILADENDSRATFILAGLYFYGTKWTKKDPQLALSLYTRPCLKTSGFALTQIGQLLQSGLLKTIDHKKAMEYYAKASALEIGLASMKLADCYLYGLGVEPDYDIAFAIYDYLWGDFLNAWMKRKGYGNSLFGDVSYKLGLCYQNGYGVQKDVWAALKYYLIAEYALSIPLPQEDYDFMDVSRDINVIREKIDSIAQSEGLKKAPPCSDIDTLLDSLFSDMGVLLPIQKYTLHIDKYDEDEQIIYLTIRSKEKPFIIDTKNLFVGFVNTNTHWALKGTIIESLEKDASFNCIRADGRDISFVNVQKDKEYVALRFEAEEPQNEEEVASIKENLA